MQKPRGVAVSHSEKLKSARKESEIIACASKQIYPEGTNAVHLPEEIRDGVAQHPLSPPRYERRKLHINCLQFMCEAALT